MAIKAGRRHCKVKARGIDGVKWMDNLYIVHIVHWTKEGTESHEKM